MAKALGGAFDVQPEFFVNLQRIYDLSQARDPDPNVARKARLQAQYPVREMIRRGWFINSEASLLEAQMARFFEVESTEEIPYFAHAAKKDYEHASPSQIAWLYRVRQIAKEMVVPIYSEKALRASLAQIRRLMIAPEETRHVPRILSECGVRYVIVEALPSAKIDGVCFWLESSPVIGMSVHRDRIDNFFFVLRHEIEHVLRKHGRTQEIIDIDLEGDATTLGASRAEEERIANLEASDFCVPISEMDSWMLRKQPFFSEKDTLAFARRMQIHPGIVAGQLRKRLNKWDLFTRMLVKVRHNVIQGATVDGWGQIAPVSL
jgi:HTH-type transcriptional regulator/antitoxin HigA